MRSWKKAVGVLLMAVGVFGLAPSSLATSAYIFAFTPAGQQNLVLNGDITVAASKTGWVSDRGETKSGNPNYYVGGCNQTCGFSAYKMNNFFTFDLSNVTVPITSAVISVGSSPSSIGIFDAVDITWDLHDLSKVLAKAGIPRAPDDANGRALYDGINAGASFGSWKVDPASAGSQVEVKLNDAAVKQINASIGHEFGVGGSLRWTNIISSVPEPSTWLLMILGFGVIGYTMRRRGARITASQIA